ncbi:MAG: hypothetical protein KBG02_11445 [Haliscomenobacter sp.]|jgi:hypothetical protein|nr:hypothetical protein [Haliscomenobacter sp.]MBP9077467.1 hypothetical protein [Haliscomenobacter sp.]MBV6428322.1 hypothetical protein [Haliscomenobacter sp.]
MNHVVETLFTSEKYTTQQMILYYLGAFSWFSAYILVVRRIIREKFIEFPGFIIAGNVPWELLWGFYFPLDFGGVYLLWLWRCGALLDCFNFYAVLRWGRQEALNPYLRKYHVPVMIGSFVVLGALNYFYTAQGWDLPFGIRSAMIQNVIMSTMCIVMVLKFPQKQFSKAVGWLKFFGTSVFFNIFIFSVWPEDRFTQALGITCILLDLIHIYLVSTQKWKTKALEQQASIA